MHRVGENEHEDSKSEEVDIENNSSDEKNDDNNGHSKDQTNSNRQYNNENHHGFNFQSDYQTDPYANMGNIQTYQGRNGYMYNNWNNQNAPGRMNGMSHGNDNYNSQNTNRNQFDPRYGNSDSFNTGNSNSFGSRSNNRNFSNNNNNFNVNNNDNQTQQDRACLMHCFFHELKMVILLPLQL